MVVQGEVQVVVHEGSCQGSKRLNGPPSLSDCPTVSSRRLAPRRPSPTQPRAAALNTRHLTHNTISS